MGPATYPCIYLWTRWRVPVIPSSSSAIFFLYRCVLPCSSLLYIRYHNGGLSPPYRICSRALSGREFRGIRVRTGTGAASRNGEGASDRTRSANDARRLSSIADLRGADKVLSFTPKMFDRMTMLINRSFSLSHTHSVDHNSKHTAIITYTSTPSRFRVDELYTQSLFNRISFFDQVEGFRRAKNPGLSSAPFTLYTRFGGKGILRAMAVSFADYASRLFIPHCEKIDRTPHDEQGHDVVQELRVLCTRYSLSLFGGGRGRRKKCIKITHRRRISANRQNFCLFLIMFGWKYWNRTRRWRRIGPAFWEKRAFPRATLLLMNDTQFRTALTLSDFVIDRFFFFLILLANFKVRKVTIITITTIRRTKINDNTYVCTIVIHVYALRMNGKRSWRWRWRRRRRSKKRNKRMQKRSLRNPDQVYVA